MSWIQVLKKQDPTREKVIEILKNNTGNHWDKTARRTLPQVKIFGIKI